MPRVRAAFDLVALEAEVTLPEGTAVAVRNRFDGAWCSGFAVAEVVAGSDGVARGYRVRRCSDPGWVMPSVFSVEDVIPTRAVVDAWAPRGVPIRT